MPHPAAPEVPALVRFGVFELDRGTGELRKNGRKLGLDGQPLRLLTLLVERPGQLVTREELKRTLWPSDTFVTFDQSINSAVMRLRQALDDSARTPRFIETLPRRGYRFICPLGTATNRLEANAPPRGARRAQALAAALALIAVVTLAAFYLLGLRGIARLAVLPLQNATEDPGQDPVVDAIHDDLIVQLALLGGPVVIQRESVVRYRAPGRPPLRDIAAALRADAVLDGRLSVRGGTYHLRATLISPGSEAVLWTNEYDVAPRDARSVLSRAVVRDLAAHLGIRLTPRDQARLKEAKTRDPAVETAFNIGRYHARRMTNAETLKAVESYKTALDLDPTFADAWAALGDRGMATRPRRGRPSKRPSGSTRGSPPPTGRSAG